MKNKNISEYYNVKTKASKKVIKRKKKIKKVESVAIKITPIPVVIHKMINIIKGPIPPKDELLPEQIDAIIMARKDYRHAKIESENMIKEREKFNKINVI